MALALFHAPSSSALKPRDEVLPVVVQFDAAQVQESFGLFLAPTHAGAIETLSHQVAHRPFHLTGGNHEILFEPVAITHHPGPRFQVTDQTFQGLAAAFGSRTMV